MHACTHTPHTHTTHTYTHTHPHTHTHTHIVPPNRGWKTVLLHWKISWEDKCLELAFKGREKLCCRKLLKYADESQQPKFLRTLEELEENERPVFESFSSAQYVEKLLNFLALEEQKGRDKFQLKHLTLFKVGAARGLSDLPLPFFSWFYWVAVTCKLTWDFRKIIRWVLGVGFYGFFLLFLVMFDKVFMNTIMFWHWPCHTLVIHQGCFPQCLGQHCFTAFWHWSFWNLSSDIVPVLDRFNSFNREISVQLKHGLVCNFSGSKVLTSFPPLGFRGNVINDHASLAGRVCSGTSGTGSWRCSSPT